MRAEELRLLYVAMTRARVAGAFWQLQRKRIEQMGRSRS